MYLSLSLSGVTIPPAMVSQRRSLMEWELRFVPSWFISPTPRSAQTSRWRTSWYRAPLLSGSLQNYPTLGNVYIKLLVLRERGVAMGVANWPSTKMSMLCVGNKFLSWMAAPHRVSCSVLSYFKLSRDNNKYTYMYRKSGNFRSKNIFFIDGSYEN